MEKQISAEDLQKILSKSLLENNDIIYKYLAEVNINHKADIDRQIKDFHEDIKKQIATFSGKIVGWGWFIAVLIAWTLLMFAGLVYLHNNYLTTGKKFHLINADQIEMSQGLNQAER